MAAPLPAQDTAASVSVLLYLGVGSSVRTELLIITQRQTGGQENFCLKMAQREKGSSSLGSPIQNKVDTVRRT